MRLCCNEGNFEFQTREEISAQIRKSAERPLDEIWLGGEEDYPCLGILLNGIHACLHYFNDGNGTMWQSLGTHGEEITFLAGGVEWKAPADTVVSLEDAILCAEEFFETGLRPDCIDWLEL